MSKPAIPFEELVRSRRSPRKFLTEPIPGKDIRAVLEDAQYTPSNSNTQPWVVHIVSGNALKSLGDELVAAYERDHASPDFTMDYGDGEYFKRAQQFGAVHYGTREIARSDREGRSGVMKENLRFYGAPHVAFIFMPRLGDNVRAAGDIGMYAQNFLLSLTSKGYAGIPQAVLGHYAETVRSVLGVPSDLALSFGISFGRADEASPLRKLDIERVTPQQYTVLHDTENVFNED